MPPYVLALMAHGLIGFLDVVVNHEWLHSAREFLFAALFASLAWTEWHGAFVWWIVALLAGELLVTARDVVVEGNVRQLPASERFLHLFLFLNLGILYTLTGQALIGWHALPTGLAPVDHGWASWVLSAMALGALGWAVRDGVAAVRLRQAM